MGQVGGPIMEVRESRPPDVPPRVTSSTPARGHLAFRACPPGSAVHGSTSRRRVLLPRYAPRAASLSFRSLRGVRAVSTTAVFTTARHPARRCTLPATCPTPRGRSQSEGRPPGTLLPLPASKVCWPGRPDLDCAKRDAFAQ